MKIAIHAYRADRGTTVLVDEKNSRIATGDTRRVYADREFVALGKLPNGTEQYFNIGLSAEEVVRAFLSLRPERIQKVTASVLQDIIDEAVSYELSDAATAFINTIDAPMSLMRSMMEFQSQKEQRSPEAAELED